MHISNDKTPLLTENDNSIDSIVAPNAHSLDISFIDVKYLGGAIAGFATVNRAFGVKSTYGTGKTTAIKKLISDAGSTAKVLMLFPRKLLAESISSELSLNCYIDVKAAHNSKRSSNVAVQR
jgi:hypothetical protein